MVLLAVAQVLVDAVVMNGLVLAAVTTEVLDGGSCTIHHAP